MLTKRNQAMTLGACAATVLALSACSSGGAPAVTVPTASTSTSSTTSTTSTTQSATTETSQTSTTETSASTETSPASDKTYASDFGSLADQQGWSNGTDDKKGSLGFSGGTYNADIKPGGTWIVSHDKFRYENADAVTMTFDSAGMTGNPFTGLICFADIVNNKVESFYDITIRPNGAVSLYRFDKGKDRGVKISGSAATGFTPSGAHLEFSCTKQGDKVHFRAVVNGQQVIDADDPNADPLAPGKFRMEMLSETSDKATVKLRTINLAWHQTSTSSDNAG